MVQVALIREAECIGCAKCILACPVDAILGSLQQMHTVITNECIGCKLCIPPCPVDCIDMVSVEMEKPDPLLVRRRHQARKIRLVGEVETPLQSEKILSDKKSYVVEAVARTIARRQKTRN